MNRCARRRSEGGYVLLVILFMLALLTLALVTAAPPIARRIQRAREQETIHRGKEYARAIRLFYRKFGRYPNTIKDLLETNNLRFLRKEYKDPESDNGEWRLIHVGQSQFAPTGFFGKSLLGPNAANGNGASPFGAPAASGNGNSSSSPSDGNNSSGQPQPAGASGAGFGNLTGQTFGGGPIVGVAPLSTKESLLVYNGKDHYNQWEFVYDPRMEQVIIPQGVQVQPGSQGNVSQPQPNPNPGVMNPMPH